jgi:sphingomyelin phosphodiesterase acid-like 3
MPRRTPHLRLLALVVLLAAALALHAQVHAAVSAAPTQPIVMLSDIHLDPFHDPAKFDALRKAPATAWQSILGAPDSPTQMESFSRLADTCKAKGLDTPYALLRSALDAAHGTELHPLFVTVSGDLMAHQFDCKFHTLAPSATEADYAAFAAKTIAFVALQLRVTFAGAPVYLALGNNDSGCKDYREDPHSAYLREDALAVANDAKASGAARAEIVQDFSAYGDYSVALPAPIEHTRLIVLQDIFASKKYTRCNGDATTEPAQAQIEWLKAQLASARAVHEHVWVMAHIPPGVDAYATFTKAASAHPEILASMLMPTANTPPVDVCSMVKKPETFLADDALATAIEQNADVIRLVLFGHTHMDELRLYHGAHGELVPGRLTPSITPINGNHPSYTIAQVEPKTATIADYTVYFATSTAAQWGSATWAREYSYGETYHQPDLSGASVAAIMQAFRSDPAGDAPESLAYQRNFYAGNPLGDSPVKAKLKTQAMKVVWPLYTCAMTEPHTADFTSCVCGR